MKLKKKNPPPPPAGGSMMRRGDFLAPSNNPRGGADDPSKNSHCQLPSYRLFSLALPLLLSFFIFLYKGQKRNPPKNWTFESKPLGVEDFSLFSLQGCTISGSYIHIYQSILHLVYIGLWRNILNHGNIEKPLF